MSNIAYDPIKNKLTNIVGNSYLKRTLLLKLLDLFFLRSWYVKKLLKKYGEEYEARSKKSLKNTHRSTHNKWFVMDAGCGMGQYDKFLLKKFENVDITAVDLKDNYLKTCKEYFKKDIDAGRISFYSKNLIEIEYQQKFDIVMCIDVLEHIEEDECVIKNISRALQPEGYFIMHSPSNIYCKNKDCNIIDEHYRQGYSREEITDKLSRHGLEVLQTQYTYGIAGHIAWIIGVRIPIILINKLKVFGIMILFPYMLLILPFFIFLNFCDIKGNYNKGRGIYALAKKK